MSRTYFILCFLLALSACSPKDDSAPAPGDVFIKYFGNLEEDEAVDMVLLDDGSDNVVIAGNYTDRDTTSIYLLVADQNGNLIRENYIRSDSSNSLDLARIRLGSSAGSATSDLILMAGNTMVDDTTRAFWAVANVADLSYQFGGVLELQDSPDAQNRPKSAKATDILQIEQDFVVLGDEDNVFSEGASPSNQRRQVFITRLNANNNRIWRKFQGFSGNDFAESFFLQTNGSFAICGSTDSRSPTGSTGMNMLFLQTDSLGSSLSQRIFGTDGDFSEEARDMVNNGTGFAVIGNTNSGGTTQPFLSRSTAEGGVVIDVQLNGASQIPTSISAISRTRTGNYVIAGTFTNFDPDQGGAEQSRLDEVGLIITDSFGGFISAHSFGTPTGSDQGVATVILPNDKMLILATIDFGGGRTMLGLIKVNADGQLDN